MLIETDSFRREQLEKIQYYRNMATVWENIDPEILAQAYEVPMMFVKAILPHLPIELSPNQVKILETFYDPKKFYTELLLVCGRKSGKTLLVAIIVLYEVYKLLLTPDLHKKYGLIPESNIYIMVVATSREQALGVTFTYIRALAEGSWYLNDYIINVTNEEIQFAKHIIIRCQACSSRSGRGFPTWMNVYDEIAFMQTSSGNAAGDKVFDALQPNLKVFHGDGKTVALSSPAGMDGILWTIFCTGDPISVLQPQKDQGKRDWCAVFQYPTWDMNPTLPRDHIEIRKEFQSDPDNFEMEYGAKFAKVVNAALQPTPIMKCAIAKPIDPTIEEKTIPRVIVLDPATIGNGYAVTMGHMNDDGVVVADLVKVFRGTRQQPINIDNVENFVRMLNTNFKIVNIVIDQHQSYSTVQKFQSEGIPIELIHITAKFNMNAYGELIRRVNTTRIHYPNEHFITEPLKFLVKKYTGWGFRVEAARGHMDDVADTLSTLCLILTEMEGTRAGWGEL